MNKLKMPTAISQHPQSWLWRGVWKQMHEKNQMYSICICGMPGVGKSFLACSIAHLLDRSSNNIPRFDASKIFFNGTDFAKWVATPNLPKGSFCVVDDSGLSLGSREAMTRSLRAISKTFQSCRYLNRGIILTLPSFDMLDKQIRSLVSTFAQPVKINYEKEITYFKYHRLETSPRTSKIYHHRPMRTVWTMHPTGYPLKSIRVQNSLPFAKPPQALVDDYEKAKFAYLNEWNRRNVGIVEAAENPKPKFKENTFQKYYDIVFADKKKYAAKGKRKLYIDMAKILLAHPGCGSFNATAIAQSINRELKGQGKK